MKDTTYVPLKNELLLRLIDRYKENYPVAIDDVIEEFLERTAEDHEARPGSGSGGFIWDQLELPEGTELRTRYQDQWHTATLRKGKFYFKNRPYKSPAKVCNAMRGNKTTNAWMMLQIKRPQDIEFRKAEKFRS